jgi:hypothetical protein
MKPTIDEIKNNESFDEHTYSDYFGCYIIRKKMAGRRGWIFNGSMNEYWIPYKDLKLSMMTYSYKRDVKDFITKTYRETKFFLKKVKRKL